VRVELRFGDGILPVEVPADRATVIAPAKQVPAGDARALVVEALRRPVAGPPLRQRVRPGQRVAISVCDGTRAQPRTVVIPAILDELDGIVEPDDIVILIATGTHRGNTVAEIEEMFGRDVVEHARILNHDARDEDSLVWVGYLGSRVPVWLNREWLDADVRITTGLVEPHFFAGFSGGPKMVAPGLAGLETTLALHDAVRIAHPDARWGITHGNPVHEDVRSIAAGTGTTFCLDVLVDAEKRIVSAFGGDLFAAHEAACKEARRGSMRPVPADFDVVVTTNAGFPLDQNLYQAVKGISAAAQIVKPGGLIVCAAECRDGFPDHGSYRSELTSAASPLDLLATIESRTETIPDQWQIQIQARLQSHARVIMHTAFLSDRELAEAHLEQTSDVSATVADALLRAGPEARVCVLPEGPHVVPYIAA
jgi:nickel-dependent lactate racemase